MISNPQSFCERTRKSSGRAAHQRRSHWERTRDTPCRAKDLGVSTWFPAGKLRGRRFFESQKLFAASGNVFLSLKKTNPAPETFFIDSKGADRSQNPFFGSQNINSGRGFVFLRVKISMSVPEMVFIEWKVAERARIWFFTDEKNHSASLNPFFCVTDLNPGSETFSSS